MAFEYSVAISKDLLWFEYNLDAIVFFSVENLVSWRLLARASMADNEGWIEFSVQH